jgi:hypothetical protein
MKSRNAIIKPSSKERAKQQHYQGGIYMKVSAYLEITMKISDANRPAAAKVYTDYRGPFLEQIPGALTKDLLIREEDVQVLHGFDSVEHAQAYLSSEMFQNDVFVGLKPLWSADPDVKIYSVA